MLQDKWTMHRPTACFMCTGCVVVLVVQMHCIHAHWKQPWVPTTAYRGKFGTNFHPPFALRREVGHSPQTLQYYFKVIPSNPLQDSKPFQKHPFSWVNWAQQSNLKLSINVTTGPAKKSFNKTTAKHFVFFTWTKIINSMQDTTKNLILGARFRVTNSNCHYIQLWQRPTAADRSWKSNSLPRDRWHKVQTTPTGQLAAGCTWDKKNHWNNWQQMWEIQPYTNPVSRKTTILETKPNTK